VSDLDIKLYDKHNGSIKDLSKDLDISDTKWNKLFTSWLGLFNLIYFKGYRHYYIDEEFDQTIKYLSDKILINETKKHPTILFQLGKQHLSYNRKLASKLWWYFEFPCFIFLGNEKDEQIITDAYKSKMLDNDIINSVDDIVILYRGGEQNVLWIKSNLNLEILLLPYLN
jgi:hypothetical protein